MTNLKKMQKTPELQAQYAAWLKDPMTQFVVDTVRQYHRPQMPNLSGMDKPIETLAALFAEAAGIEMALDTFMSLNKIPVIEGGEVEATWADENQERGN